jgi:hypothetical protein
MGAHRSFLPALLTLLVLLSHPPELSFALQGTFVIQTGPCFPGPWESHLSPPFPPFATFPPLAPHSCGSPHHSPTPCTYSLEILQGGPKPQGTQTDLALELESHPTLLGCKRYREWRDWELSPYQEGLREKGNSVCVVEGLGERNISDVFCCLMSF